MNMLSETAEHKIKNYSDIWQGVEKILNAEYIPKWKKDLAKALEENTKEVTNAEAISTIEFMKNEGISEDFIRKHAKQKKVSMKKVDDILDTGKAKKAVGG